MYPYNTDWITKKIMAASIEIEIKRNYLLVLGFYQEQIHYRIWMTYIVNLSSKGTNATNT